MDSHPRPLAPRADRLARTAVLTLLAAIVIVALQATAHAGWEAGFAAGFHAGGVRLTHDEGVAA